MLTDVQEAFLNPKTGGVGAATLAKRLRKPLAEVQRELAKLPEYQRTLPSKAGKGRQYQITSGPDSYQVDLVFMPGKSKNKGFPGFFLCEEITSRKAYAYPIKSKKVGDILAALKAFDRETAPESISSDNEPALLSGEVQEWLQDNLIHHSVHRAGDHNALGMIDRLVRTIKEIFQRLNTVVWLNVLSEVVSNYNSKEHRSLDGMTPDEVEVDAGKQEKIRLTKGAHNRRVLSKTAVFDEGDIVRVLMPLGKVEKGRARYSAEVYTVVRLTGLSYVVRSAKGKESLRRPYELVAAGNEASEDEMEEVKKSDRAALRLKREGLD